MTHKPFLLKKMLLALMVAGCHPNTPPDSNTEAFSNRPENVPFVLQLIRLQTPPVQSANSDQEKQQLLAQIEAEQGLAINKLESISSDIKILNRYRLLINALHVKIPSGQLQAALGISNISYHTGVSMLPRLEIDEAVEAPKPKSMATENSVSFIGAHLVHDSIKIPTDAGDVAIKGQGIRIGVLDTGIDYTHAMFLGSGKASEFETNDPNIIEDATFPTSKVTGGFDFVGTSYNAASPNFDDQVPKPDADPIDEGRHGTHVAGTIAGIGDTINTYSGVAPDASLYSLKVFGKDGSTSDAVVIAALEYAMDPNGDLDTTDKLDVVNLSLGSSYGTSLVLYNEAMTNLANSGVLIAASAGNSGDQRYIVGSPGTSAGALSVAASIDNMEHNWQFGAIEFSTANHDSIIAQAVEASFSKKISEIDQLTEELVFIGLADKDLTEEEAAKVKGHIALIDRGVVTFGEKVTRAYQAGALGVVVANNVDGEPFLMGGDDKVDIPAVMISKTQGDILKEELKAGKVTINFKSTKKIEKPELIDTLTDFSSRGPRSLDGMIKPEISAPGAAIISASAGTGYEGVALNGTSMAAPHMAGVFALLKQRYGDLSTQQIYSLVTSTAKKIADKTGTIYPISNQGAGRVQVYDAITAPLSVLPATVSLGEVVVETSKTFRKVLELQNISAVPTEIHVATSNDKGLQIAISTQNNQISLAAHEKVSLPLIITVDATQLENTSEVGGYVLLTSSNATDKRTQHIPVMAMVNKLAIVKASKAQVHASSIHDSANALVTVDLHNTGSNAGQALLFNTLGHDKRKSPIKGAGSDLCDLESAGYRLVEDDTGSDVLQVAVKLYHPVTSWHLCEVSMLIDSDNDGVADQELLGTALATLSGNSADARLVTVLTDAHKMRQLRKEYETKFPDLSQQDYTTAAIDSNSFDTQSYSTIAVLNIPTKSLGVTASGEVRYKLAVLAYEPLPGGVGDDFLANHEQRWSKLSLKPEAQAVVGIPTTLELASNDSQTVSMKKGYGRQSLIAYYPNNAVSLSDIKKDEQSQQVTFIYLK